MGGKYTWTNADGLTQRGGPLAPDTGSGETQLEIEYEYLAQPTLGSAGYGEEADMLASGAIVGSTFVRTDIGDSPGTLYECFALPSTDASSWRVYTATAGISAVYETDAELQAAAAASELTYPADYYTTTDGTRWFATAADTATPVAVTTARFRGRLTLAQILAIASPNDGDTAQASNIDNGYMVWYDGTAAKWRGMHPLTLEAWDRVAGPITYDESGAVWVTAADGGWTYTPGPAGFWRLFKQFDAHYHGSRVTSNDNYGSQMKLSVYLGTLGSTSDANIHPSFNIVGTDGKSRSPRFSFLLSGDDSVRIYGDINASGTYSGASGTNEPGTAVTLANVDTFDLALGFYARVTDTIVAVSATPYCTPTLSLRLTFIP